MNNIAMRLYQRIYQQLTLAIVVLSIAACASGPERSVSTAGDPDDQLGVSASSEAAATEAVGSDPFPGFKRLYIQGGGLLYVRDQSAFESYDNWLLDEAGIEFDKAQVPLNANEQAQLRMLMFKARVQQTKYYGSVVKKPSACTLTQQLHLKRLRLYKSASEGPVVNFISSFGEAVIVAEIKDSLSGEMVFAYVEPVRLGRGVTKSASPDMGRLATAMNEAMERAHRALVEQLPVDRERIDDRANVGCKGQIGRNVLEIRNVLQQG